MTQTNANPPDPPVFDELLQALKKLDQILEQAITLAQASYGEDTTADPYRGLYITAEQAEQSIKRESGCFATGFTGFFPSLASYPSRLQQLAKVFNLRLIDLDLIILALAPEIDLCYERIYAYLQDDVTRKRPNLNLALNLFCSSLGEKLKLRPRFSSSAPLIYHQIIDLIEDGNQPQPPLLAHILKLDQQVLNMILGDLTLDVRLAPFCQLLQPLYTFSELYIEPEIKHGLQKLVGNAMESCQPLQLYFRNPNDIENQETAIAIAQQIGYSILIVNLAQVIDHKLHWEMLLKYLIRETQIQKAVLYLYHWDLLCDSEQETCRLQLLTGLAQNPGITIISGQGQWLQFANHGFQPFIIEFSIPAIEQRRQCWQAKLEQSTISLDQLDIDILSRRFKLMPSQIANAVDRADRRIYWSAISQSANTIENSSTLDEIFRAARAQSGHSLTTLARKINPNYTWQDIILPTSQKAQLQEICDQVKNWQTVYQDWGFNQKLSLGKGLNVLFYGPPGTGKTMAAEVIAHELKLDLYKIDLSQIVNKYIGETEKNLDRIFTAAQNSNAILFFDEADALFGKRSEVKDAHDRYANIEVGYLLQKMEEHDGIAILATNLRQNLDDAFIRRIQIVIDFPFPDAEQRRSIWQSLIPEQAPQSDDIDFEFLAQEIKLAGANLKNIVLTAAFYAANQQSRIRMEHLLQAADREHQKLGRSWNNLTQNFET
jgi:ATP-dependent 26S proteasome regulatory subunit